MGEAAKVIVGLEFDDNSGVISNKVKQASKKIADNADDIKLKLADPDMKEYTKKIQTGMAQINKLVKHNGKLGNVKHISSQTEDLYESFANPKNSVKQWAESVADTEHKLNKLAQVSDSRLLENFQAQDLSKVVTKYEELAEKQYEYDNVKKNSEEKFFDIKNSQQTASNILEDLQNEDNKNFQKNIAAINEAVQEENLKKVAESLGVDSKNENAMKQVKNNVLQMTAQQLLTEEKNSLNLDKSDDILRAGEITKQLMTLRAATTKTEDGLVTKYGARKKLSNTVNGFTAPILDTEFNSLRKKYITASTEEMQRDVEDTKLAIQQYILKTAKKRNATQQERNEKVIQGAEEKFQQNQEKLERKRNGNQNSNSDKTGDNTNNGEGSNTNNDGNSGNGEGSESKEDSGNNPNTPSGNENNADNDAEDIWKVSYEKIKDKYSKKAGKYAISEDEAIEQLSKIKKKSEEHADDLTDNDYEKFLGLNSRLYSLNELGKLKNTNILSDLDDILGVFDELGFRDYDSDKLVKLQKDVTDMTTDQMSVIDEMEKTKKAKENSDDKSESDKKSNNDKPSEKSDSKESIDDALRAAEELEGKLTTLQQTISDLSNSLSGLDGSAFSQMNKEVGEMQESLQKTIDNLSGLKKTQTPGHIDVDDADRYGDLSTVDTISEFHKKFKTTDAYKKNNDKIEERAIGIKNGHQVGQEAIMSSDTGAVSINEITKNSPDSILHTHPFDNNTDNLRFSDADIQELVNGTFNKAFLVCGDELLTMDMSGVKPKQFKNLREDILNIYQAVCARYGAEIKDGAIGGLDTLPEEYQDEATKVINTLLRNRLQEAGGNLFFDKITDSQHGNLLDAIDDDKVIDFKDRRNQHEESVLDQFLDATIAENPSERFKNLQKKYPISEKNQSSDNNSQYEEQLSSVQQELDQVKAEYQQLSEEMLQLKSQLESKSQESELEKEGLEVESTDVDHNSNTYNDSDHNIKVYDADQFSSVNSDYEEELASMDSTYTDQFSSIQQELTQIKSEYQQLSKKNSQLESQLKESETEKEELTKEEEQKKVSDETPIGTVSEKAADTDQAVSNAEPVTSSVGSEISNMSSLESAVRNVIAAVDDKTKAFEQEGKQVSSAVESEINDLKNLEKAVKDVKDKEEKVKEKTTDDKTDQKDTSDNSEKPDQTGKDSSSDNNQQKSQDNNSKPKKKPKKEQDTSSDHSDNISKKEEEINKRLNDSESLKSNINSQFENMDPVSEKANARIESLNDQLKSGNISVQKYDSELQKLSDSLKRVDDYANDADDAIEKMTQNAMELSNGEATITSSKKKDNKGNEVARVVASWDGQKITGIYTDQNSGISYETQTTRSPRKNRPAQQEAPAQQERPARQERHDTTEERTAERETRKAAEQREALERGNNLKSSINADYANMPPVLESANSRISALNEQLSSGSITVKKYDSELNKLSNSLKRVDDYADNADNAIEKMTQKAMELSNGRANITSSKTTDNQGNEIAKVIASWDGSKMTGTFNDVNKGISFVTQQTETSTSSIGNFFDGLKDKWVNLGQYLLSFQSFDQIFDILKDGFDIIHELDDSLTEMNKVSNEPLEKLKEYQKESFDIASDIGTTGQQIQNSTADFLRLGESFDEAKESAKAANVLLNVSEFSSIDEATESLISMSSAYKDLDKMEIDDKLNNVGNNFSIGTDGLATALQKSASALTTAGNDIDKSIALITAGNAVVQDPDSVGAGIRTIALRLTGTEEAKKELEDTGEDTSDFIVQTASKINDSFKAFTAVESNNFKGISLLDENGNNRDTYDVLQDVANIYDEIIETDKKYGTNHMNGLLELMAGKNRANIAASIIQNGDMLKDVYETSQHSEGSALEENQKQLDSISGHMDQLKNKWQEVWAGAASRDQVNLVLDGLNGILSVVNKIGLVKTSLFAGLGLKGLANKVQGKPGIVSGLFG